MAAYSSFFASGLLAPSYHRDVSPPSSPAIIPRSPIGPVDRSQTSTPTPISSQPHKSDVTPTGTANALSLNTHWTRAFSEKFDSDVLPSTTTAGYATSASAASDASVSERPRLRRRRSSLTVGSGPLASIKSPSRNAGAALQRTGVTSPSRSRSGSIIEGSMSVNEMENTSIIGRLRSGSLNMPGRNTQTNGASIRPRRVSRRPLSVAFRLAPVPPPMMPLPSVPASPDKPLTSPTSAHYRHPLAVRSQSSFGNSPVDSIAPALPSPSFLHPDFASKASWNPNDGYTKSPVDPVRPYFGDVDQEMSCN